VLEKPDREEIILITMTDKALSKPTMRDSRRINDMDAILYSVEDRNYQRKRMKTTPVCAGCWPS
jgi:hypothetical protein